MWVLLLGFISLEHKRFKQIESRRGKESKFSFAGPSEPWGNLAGGHGGGPGAKGSIFWQESKKKLVLQKVLD